jgi:hypothetical protein
MARSGKDRGRVRRGARAGAGEMEWIMEAEPEVQKRGVHRGGNPLPPAPPLPIPRDWFRPGHVIIVTGLPRSGTSMAMQMLEAAGLPVLTDGVRQADQFNARGYYEYAPVKRLDRDNAWLHEAGGKVVKIVAPLLHHVPETLPCQVVFMERGLEHVLASQARMMGREDSEAERRIARAAMEKCLAMAWTWASCREHWRLRFEELVGRGA